MQPPPTSCVTQWIALFGRATLRARSALPHGRGPGDHRRRIRPPSRRRPPAAPGRPFDHVQFGVAFEGFYQYNWNRPYDRINLLRAYDTRANVFGIQQAALVVESAPDVDAGPPLRRRASTCSSARPPRPCRAAPANEPRPDVYRHVWQAYGTYVFPVGRGLQADFGKFASNLGYETNYAKDNNHFSRAYLFNFLPFYHSGLRADACRSTTRSR